MKIITFPLIKTGFLFAMSIPALVAQDQNPDAITWISSVEAAPVIDGRIDQVWHAQPPFPISVLTNGSVTDDNDFSAEWYGLYDDSFFYVLIDIHDQILESEAASAGWKNDRIETYFNMDNFKPGGSSHNGDNYQFNFRWNKPDEQSVNNNTWDGIEWACFTTDYGYTTEIKFPWTKLTTPSPSMNFSFGFDIAIIDNDGSDNYDSITYWWNSTGQAEYSNIDGAGTVGLGMPFDGNYAPSVDPVEVQIVLENQHSSFLVSATDSNQGDALLFSLLGAPAFASLQDNGDGTALISVLATTGTADIYTFHLNASDGSKSADREIILIVKDPNVEFQQPSLDSIPDTAVQQGNQITLRVQARDKDSLKTTISAVDLPNFASLLETGDKSALLVLNPDFETSPGTYEISLWVEDMDGQTGSTSFDVLVEEAPEQSAFFCDPVNGDMQNDGTMDNPWSTLQAVFEAGKLFKPGDVIYMLDGYHGEPVISGTHSGYVRIVPYPGANPTLSKLSFDGNSSYWEARDLEISRSFAPEFSQDRMVEVFGDNIILKNSLVCSTKDSSQWTVDDWRGKASRGIFVNGSHNLVKGCTFLNVSYGIHVVGTFNSVVDNQVQNFSADGMLGLGNDLLFESNYVADNYNVDDNHDDGFQSWSTGSGGPGSGVVYRNTLRGNTIIQTTDPDRPFQGSLQGIGCFGGMYDHWVIENNVVVVNHFHGITLYGGIECRIVNNTVVDLDLESDPGPTWIHISTHKSYNSAQTQEEKDYYFGRDNVVKNNLVTALAANPLFGTIENNLVIDETDIDQVFLGYPFDLHLKPGSPAIDAGALNGATEIDADGSPRPIDGNSDGTVIPDIGAYEFSQWRNLPVYYPYYVDMGSNIGWIYTAFDPWILLLRSSKWAYIAPDWNGEEGGWTWFPH